MAIWFDLQGCAFWSHKHSEWVVNIIFYFCQRVPWFDLQGCTFWSHKYTELAVTGIVKLSSLNDYGLTYRAASFDLTKIMIGFFTEFSNGFL